MTPTSMVHKVESLGYGVGVENYKSRF